MDIGRACAAGTLSQNNLGGLGPTTGEQIIRYPAVGTLANGDDIDMVVRVATSYTSGRASVRNGCNGVLGEIHVDSDTSNDLTVRASASASASIRLS